MSCEKYKSQIAGAAADVAAAFRPADVPFDPDLAAHLESCASCRAEFESQRALLASIDRGLAEMVAPEPSGDFAAHVRQRIAQDGIATRPWFAGWLPVSAATLALVVLVTFLMLRRDSAPSESAKETPPAETARPPREPQWAQKAPQISIPSSASGPRTIRPPRSAHSAANREPEVLVPRGEMAAVMRLFNANWSGKADGTSLTAQSAPMSDSLKPLSIEELKIPALEVIPLGSGELSKSSPEK